MMPEVNGRISGIRQAVKLAGTAGMVDDALHDLAQPLTAMLFVLEMARLQQNPEAWRKAVETSLEECHRAVKRLEAARQVAAQCASQTEDGGSPWATQ